MRLSIIVLRVAEVPIEPFSPFLSLSFSKSIFLTSGSVTYFAILVISSFKVAFVYRDGGFVSFSSNRASIAVPEYIPSAIVLSSVTSSAFISLNIAVYPFFKTTVEYAASVYSPSSSIVILVFSLTALGKNCAI